MTPDLNASIDNHHATMAQWWRHPRHIAARKEQVRKHPKCSRCGRPATLVLHEYPDDYEHGFEHYIELIEKGLRPTGCPACNKAERAGRRPCPSCVEKYHSGKQDRIRYIPQDQEICAYCEDPGFVERVKAGKADRNRQRNQSTKDRYAHAHPTVKRVVNGKWVEIPR